MYIQKTLILFSLAFSPWVQVIKPLYPSNSWQVMKQKVKMQQSTYLKKFSRVYHELLWSASWPMKRSLKTLGTFYVYTL